MNLHCAQFGVARGDDGLWHAFANYTGRPRIVMRPGYEDRDDAIAHARLAAATWERAMTEEGVPWFQTIGRGTTGVQANGSTRPPGPPSTPPTER